MKITRSEMLLMLTGSVIPGLILYWKSGNILSSLICFVAIAACMASFYYLAFSDAGKKSKERPGRLSRSEVLSIFSNSIIAGFIFYWQFGNVLYAAVVLIITAALFILFYYLAYRIWRRIKK